MMTTRFIVGVPVAAAITFALFVIMKGMIAGGDRPPQEVYEEQGIIIIGREDREEATQIDDPAPPKARPDEPELPKITISELPDGDPDDEMTGTGLDPVKVIIDGAPTGVCGQPIVRVAPTYPRRAVEQGIEGYAVVQFTVTKEGAVKDAVVIEQEPGNVFGSSARRAVERWRYQPCKVNGKVEEVRLEVRLVFELDKS